MSLRNAEEYINYLEEKKNFDRSWILLPDSNSYDSFFYKVYGDRLGYYFGTFLNDSVSIRRSEMLNDKFTCMGRVLKNMAEGLESLEGNHDSLLELSNFNAFKFVESSTGIPYQINNSSKPLKIFLLYSYSSGKLFDKSYREIFKFADKHKDSIEIKIIPTDRIMYRQ